KTPDTGPPMPVSLLPAPLSSNATLSQNRGYRCCGCWGPVAGGLRLSSRFPHVGAYCKANAASHHAVTHTQSMSSTIPDAKWQTCEHLKSQGDTEVSILETVSMREILFQVSAK